MPTREELKMLQALPLDVKIRKTQQRIQEWVEFYGQENVYVSFSGGKDSTVLLHIARHMYPDIKAIFVNTGLEYPEIVEFVSLLDNVEVIRPDMNFKQVLTEYGYPVISKQVSKAVNSCRRGVPWALDTMQGINHKTGEKSQYVYGRFGKWNFLLGAPFMISHKCCEVMKEKPLKQSKLHPIIGTLAEESRRREVAWTQTGCNSFKRYGSSKPLSFWTNKDILEYIYASGIKIASVYGEVLHEKRTKDFCLTGCERTGCMFCILGAQVERGEGRLAAMRRMHPKRYEYVMGGGEFDDQGMWIPNNKGLGFKFVVDWLNENGNLNIRY